MSEFDASRRRALVSDLLARLAGQPVDLLPFEEVRERLRLRHLVDRGRREVPLDRIVGSVGRAHEFNRFLLPRQEASRDRWQRIEQLAEGPVGFAPIDLYQVGGSFFVVDGHHRVSVARALGAPAIEGWVQEFLTPLTLAPAGLPAGGRRARVERGAGAVPAPHGSRPVPLVGGPSGPPARSLQRGGRAGGSRLKAAPQARSCAPGDAPPAGGARFSLTLGLSPDLAGPWPSELDSGGSVERPRRPPNRWAGIAQG